MSNVRDVSVPSKSKTWWEGSRKGALRTRVSPTLLATLLVAAPLGAARVEIVLDSSGSMRGSAGATSKMEAARQAVRTTVEAIDPSSHVALRLYGHRLPSEPEDPSCRDTELVIPFGPVDRSRFVAAVEAAEPLGQTPLAYSLEQAAADFGDLGDEAAAVILVSDGEETCGGDPAAVACAFADRGLALTVHTVGFDVDEAARRQLQAVANCTGGEYRDARDADELGESLRQLTQAGLLVDKEREALGREIRGGDGFASAVPITPGTYRLDHHQRPNEYDYFSIEVEPGHLLRVTQLAYEVGVTIHGDSFTEGAPGTNRGGSAAGVAIHGPDRARIRGGRVISPGERATAWTAVTAGEGGTYYFRIGQDMRVAGGIHKNSPITVEIVDQTDAGSGTDAGHSDREAVPIEAGDHRAWIQAGDEADVFTFPADPVATYGIRVRPDETAPVLEIVVRDEDGVQLASAKAPNNGAVVRLEEFRLERKGPTFVTVRDTVYPSDRTASAYSLELNAEGGSVVETAEETLEEEAGDAQAAEEPSDTVGGGLGWIGGLLLFLVGLGAGVSLGMFLGRR